MRSGIIWVFKGRAISFEPGADAALRVGLLSIHQDESGARQHGQASDRLSLEQLRGQRDGYATGKRTEWVTPHGEYLALGSEDSKRLAAYRGLFATDLDAELMREIRTSTHGGYAIGDSRFREGIEQALKQRATPRGPGRPGESTGTRQRA